MSFFQFFSTERQFGPQGKLGRRLNEEEALRRGHFRVNSMRLDCSEQSTPTLSRQLDGAWALRHPLVDLDKLQKQPLMVSLTITGTLTLVISFSLTPSLIPSYTLSLLYLGLSLLYTCNVHAAPLSDLYLHFIPLSAIPLFSLLTSPLHSLPLTSYSTFILLDSRNYFDHPFC